MTGFRLPREHGGWTMWLAAGAAGVAHASLHGAPRGRVGGLALGLVLAYAAGDWLQSAAAAAFRLPFHGASRPGAWAGPGCLAAGLVLAAAAGAGVPGWAGWLAAALGPAGAATALRAAWPAFDRRLLAVSSFALAAPTLLFGILAAPGCHRCALAFWALPATGFPVMALAIAARLPAPPATVRRLGWLAAAATLAGGAAWVAWSRRI
jgi:hypothetical protein